MRHPDVIRGAILHHREQLALDELDCIRSEIGAARYRRRVETIAALETELANALNREGVAS